MAFDPVQKKAQGPMKMAAVGPVASPLLKVRPFAEPKSESGEGRDLFGEYVRRRAVVEALEAGGTAGSVPGRTVQAKGKQSKHDRKNRRLAKQAGLHLSEVDPTPRNIEAESRLRFFDDDEPEEENDDDENVLVRAAEALSGSFIWTSPGGTLFYPALFKHWVQYAAWLRTQVGEDDQEKFDQLDSRIRELEDEAEEEAYAPLLKGVRALVEKKAEEELDENSSISLPGGDQFKKWLEDGTKPAYLNCWEAVLFACVEAGKLDREEMLSWHTNAKNKDSEAIFRKFVLDRAIEELEDDEVVPDHSPVENAEPGDILCFWEDDSISHVAIYLGEGKCKSIWVDDTLKFETTTYERLCRALRGGTPGNHPPLTELDTAGGFDEAHVDNCRGEQRDEQLCVVPASAGPTSDCPGSRLLRTDPRHRWYGSALPPCMGRA